jgi:bifunctional UDP-N-acetylglucosamine pyrophosphorylase/glucosamine-1-phosphate N-acetyltransferase
MSAPVVVILAAGQGTRMRSARPKLAHELCGWPLLRWPIEAARAAGAERIVVVQDPQRALEEIAGEGVEFAIQREPRGTADALAAAAAQIKGAGSVLVVNGDTPLIRGETLRALAAEHERTGAGATMLTAVLDDPSGYGRVVRGPDGTVERVVETKASGDAGAAERHIREVNTGVFAFDSAALLEALPRVGAENAQGEHYLPDVLPLLRERERTVAALEVEDPDELLGVNDRRQLAAVRALAQRRILDRHMLAGVTVLDPASTVVDAEVTIEPDSVVAPFTSLHGATAVASGAVLGPHSTVIDARVGEDARILHSYVTGAEIGPRVSVGPFAYLRPGTVLREGSKAGTFVEIKNSDVGAGSKVPHLSYIGDAEIGEGTNLGAATITANYDGQRKHRTRIGSRVKTSVDTTLVAPVSVGDDAYTGAGSVITEDVPSGALGIARARQRNLKGYAQRRARQAAPAPEGGATAGPEGGAATGSKAGPAGPQGTAGPAGAGGGEAPERPCGGVNSGGG